MTQQEIQERNKQIALMLGWKITDGIISFIPEENPFQHEVGYSANGFLQFHSDWNWLMEAVEFIEKLRFNTKACINCENDRVYLKTYPLTQTELSKEEEYFAKFISVTDSHFEFCFNIASSKKEAVFMAVSDFAKLYNNKEL